MNPTKQFTLAAFAQETVNTRIGKLELKHGLPTKDSVAKLYDEMDFQQAVLAFQWAIPAVGATGWQHANAFYGGGGDLDLVAYKEFDAVAGIMTPNANVTYVMAFPDLSKTGPVVWEIPAGQTAGIIMDCWQNWVADFGLTGPDKGAGVRLLLIGPGQPVPESTEGYRVVQIPSFMPFMGFRILNPDPTFAKTEFEKSRIYPYSQREKPPVQKSVWAQGKTFFQAPPKGMAYWERVNEIIQREPVGYTDQFFMSMLQPLGIVKGKPFNPDARQKKLLEDAALLGDLMARANSFFSRLPASKYRTDARWESVLTFNPGLPGGVYRDTAARNGLYYQAISSSPAMVTKTPGVGSVYLLGVSDKAGAPLDGGKTYRLHVPPNPPMKQFWAATIYDIETRAFIQNGEQRSEISSKTTGIKTNADGSVDVYVGPTAPQGFEGNWVKSVPGKAWFTYFRLYAPTEAYFDQSWPLPDFDKVK
jgi:hypothetical protein